MHCISFFLITAIQHKIEYLSDDRGDNMIHTLEDFKQQYQQIVNMGWIPSHRPGPTGIGKTLEDLLGIPENNIDGPDFGDYELKSGRIDGNSMLTILTKAPQPRGVNTALRLNFGYSSSVYSNEERVLHATLSANFHSIIPNTGHSLTIACDRTKISILDENGTEQAYWVIETLKNAFNRKYPNKLVYVKAKAKTDIYGNEEFQFLEAYEVSGLCFENFISLIAQGKIYIDLRIGQYHSGSNAGKTHDHGTAFRIKEQDQPLLFTNIVRIV